MSDLKDMLVIENGERVNPTFSTAEMTARLTKLRAHMTADNIDAVVFTSMHNIHYYSDFLYCSFGRPYALVVTQDRATTVAANIDYGQPGRRSGDNLTYTDWRRDNYFRAVRQLLGNARSVGVEYDHINVENLNKMKGALPDASFSNIAPAAMGMRMVKSDEEIALIESATAIADIGGEACAAAVAPGVAEHEVAIAGTDAMVREIARRHPDSELRDTWVWFQSGINTDGAHNPVTTRQMQAGDILSLNCFPMVAGYYVALERTMFCEHASDEHLRYWEINCDVYHHGLSLIKPGARCCDIAHELNDIYASYQVLDKRTFGYGHSFGILSHYYGREAGLELREDIETVLEPNMVISIEPMITIEEGRPGAGGYREHDILVVTEDGARNITGFPVGPEKNIIKA
ncbi:MAG: creatininase [Rhodospirillaceae bacterium]|nr:creatininase [Rhodospirillaceae bacterium]|tara:strand:+ start:13960 stop:15168 length:1209 start_codon:yes stop_codon:yes gene_type:complete